VKQAALCTAGLAVASILGFGGTASNIIEGNSVAAASSPPNILFLITDQQWAGALSCAGNPLVKTPNIDTLAARGTRFEKSYCTFPLCCPSRASLFSSRMPHELNIFGNTNAELANKKVPTMGELFRTAGYETAYAGKWHLNTPFPAFSKTPTIPGFTVLPMPKSKIDLNKDGKGLTIDPNTTDAAIKFLQQPHQNPFLLTVSLLNPHDICEFAPLEIDIHCEALDKLLPADPAQLPPARPNWSATDNQPSKITVFHTEPNFSERQWQEYLHVYYRLLEKVDREIGRVLETLDQAGLTENTLVIFTSDHGEMMGSHKMFTKVSLYDESAAVPLIVAGAGTAAQVDRDHLVSGLDILPTMLAYAGIGAPPTLLGKSLKPLLSGQAISWRDFVVSETAAPGVEARMVRTSRYKYILFSEGTNREQLFDMGADPGETRNLAGDPSMKAELDRHKTLLKAWMQSTKDEVGKRKGVKFN
jgi:arylsulfatase A-like enzyme